MVFGFGCCCGCCGCGDCAVIVVAVIAVTAAELWLQFGPVVSSGVSGFEVCNVCQRMRVCVMCAYARTHA